MPMEKILLAAISMSACCFSPLLFANENELPIQVGTYWQQVHRPFSARGEGADAAVVRLGVASDGVVCAQSASGVVSRLVGGESTPISNKEAELAIFAPTPWYPTLQGLVPSRADVRDVAQHGNEVAIAAQQGLFLGNGDDWEMALPRQGDVRWAPIDVRGVTYDANGRLWFASPQGVGCRELDGTWRLYTGHDGLPYNDFTCVAAGPRGVWFGTTNGAIHFHDGVWSFRHGGRWLLDNQVHDIVIDQTGDTWLATNGGVSRIVHKEMTLDSKAQYYADEIEAHHRRTKFGYVNPSRLEGSRR